MIEETIDAAKLIQHACFMGKYTIILEFCLVHKLIITKEIDEEVVLRIRLLHTYLLVQSAVGQSDSNCARYLRRTYKGVSWRIILFEFVLEDIFVSSLLSDQVYHDNLEDKYPSFSLRLGFLKVGDQLPTMRMVVSSLAINPNTVFKAYRELEHEGLIESRPGQGTFVRKTLADVSLAIRTK